MSGLTVIFDSCALYSAPLRDLLMRLAIADVFRARWSDAIHDEWTRNVLKNRPDLKPAQIQRTRDLMNEHVHDSLVRGYEHLVPSLELPDPGDRHVLAAAIRCQADVIVTFNLKHFPASSLKPHKMRAEHPDAFVTSLLGLAPELVCRVAAIHRLGLMYPRKTAAEYLETLEKQGLPLTAASLRHFAEFS